MIIRRGSVAESFLDNLAVRLQSIRICGSGKGWRRFLVFAELTKSKKGAEYIALFTYFSLQAWIRVIFCSGPRQVVNAVTLYSVYNAKLQVDGDTFVASLESFFDKIKILAQQDYRQALILSGMLFTLIIWIFSALSFILAVLFFVFFLWGWIPKEDGGLSGYCERKISKRLMKIVSKKVDAALADQERQRKKAELKAAKKTGALPPEERKATLPTFMSDNDDKLPGMPTLSRVDTEATLPVYSSRPGSPKSGFELNQMRPMPNRTETTSTASSRAPLLSSGADMGQASPSLPSPYGPTRNGTMTSLRSPMGPPQLSRVQTNASNFSGSTLHRTQTNNSSFSGSYTQSPEDDYPPMPQAMRSPTSTTGPYGMPPRSTPAPSLNRTPTNNSYFNGNGNYGQSPESDYPMPQLTRSPTGSSVASYGMPQRSTPAPRGPYEDYNRSASPAPSQMSSRPAYNEYNRPMGPQYNQGQGMYPGRPVPAGYPNRSQTGPVPQRGPPAQPQRNMTAPMPRYGSPAPQQGYQNSAPQMYQSPPQEYINRPGTAQSQRSMQSQAQSHARFGSGSGFSDLESQRGTPGPRY